MIDGWYKYRPERGMVQKINAIRIGQSRPDLREPPILDEGDVLFSPASDTEGKPRSCYNCQFYNYEKSCKLLGKDVEVHKFTWPQEVRDGAKPIEYWPVCGYWVAGDPNYGVETFAAKINPDNAGLGWINAPKPGQDCGGSSCGGQNGGDDCDLWLIDDPAGDKRDAEKGFCRVLQKETANMDCCSCWQDDDFLTWQMVQERFRESKP